MGQPPSAPQCIPQKAPSQGKHGVTASTWLHCVYCHEECLTDELDQIPDCSSEDSHYWIDMDEVQRWYIDQAFWARVDYEYDRSVGR